MRIRSSVLVAAAGLQATSGYKDDSYYIAGTGNPNVDSRMYWKDSDNVMQDLSQFSALYVKFDSCAWTLMQASEEEGNDVDENDLFYMGKIPPFGANVAFSLYGTLKSGSGSYSGSAACNQNTFINSFHTNTGFTDFTNAMYNAGMSNFYGYTNNGDDGGSGFSAECQGGYGVGCDSVNGFALHSYSSTVCDPANFKGVKDSLSSLNSAMASADCIQIYDYTANNGYYSDGTSLELLSNSHSCFYQDFFAPDGTCPDPYGILADYQSRFHKGITESRRRNPYQLYQERKKYNQQIERGKVMSAVAIPLFILACLIFTWDVSRHGFRAKRRKIRKNVSEGRESGTNSNSSNNSVKQLDEEQGFYTCGHFDVNVAPVCGEEVNRDFNNLVGETTMVIIGEEGLSGPRVRQGPGSVSNGSVASNVSVFYPPGCVLGPECILQEAMSNDSDDGILEKPESVKQVSVTRITEARSNGSSALSRSKGKDDLKGTLPRYCPPPREDLEIDAFSLGATTIDTKDAMSLGGTTIDTDVQDVVSQASLRIQPSKDASLARCTIKEVEDEDKDSSKGSHPKIDEVAVPDGYRMRKKKKRANKVAVIVGEMPKVGSISGQPATEDDLESATVVVQAVSVSESTNESEKEAKDEAKESPDSAPASELEDTDENTKISLVTEKGGAENVENLEAEPHLDSPSMVGSTKPCEEIDEDKESDSVSASLVNAASNAAVENKTTSDPLHAILHRGENSDTASQKSEEELAESDLSEARAVPNDCASLTPQETEPTITNQDLLNDPNAIMTLSSDGLGIDREELFKNLRAAGITTYRLSGSMSKVDSFEPGQSPSPDVPPTLQEDALCLDDAAHCEANSMDSEGPLDPKHSSSTAPEQEPAETHFLLPSDSEVADILAQCNNSSSAVSSKLLDTKALGSEEGGRHESSRDDGAAVSSSASPTPDQQPVIAISTSHSQASIPESAVRESMMMDKATISASGQEAATHAYQPDSSEVEDHAFSTEDPDTGATKSDLIVPSSSSGSGSEASVPERAEPLTEAAVPSSEGRADIDTAEAASTGFPEDGLVDPKDTALVESNGIPTAEDQNDGVIDDTKSQPTVPEEDPELAIFRSRSHSTTEDADEAPNANSTSGQEPTPPAHGFDPELAILLSRETLESFSTDGKGDNGSLDSEN